VEAVIAILAGQPIPLTPDLQEYLDDLRTTRANCARALAVAGLDASWAGTTEPIVLDAEDSAFIANLLEHPGAPNDALRRAAEDYTSFIGI
jgi:hypothetical protein